MNGHNEKHSAQATAMPRNNLLTGLCLLMLNSSVVTHGSTVAPPQEIWFNSYNLKNVLEWRPGNGAGNRTRYTVQYAIYGEGEEKNKERVMWRTKKQCKGTLQTLCDLSNETSDLGQMYFARVKALSLEGSSKWATTSRFNPKLQTTFGPPTVKVTVKERKLVIKLKGPMRWRTGNSTKEYSMARYYHQMMYNVSVYNNNTKQMLVFSLRNNSMEYGLLNYSTQFCVSAKALFLSLMFKTEASQSQCVTTARDPFIDKILIVTLGCILPSAITLFFLVLVGCLVYHYIFGNRQRKPSNLWVRHLPEAHQSFCSDVHLTVNLINISMPKTDFKEEDSSHVPMLVPQEPEDHKTVVRRHFGYTVQSCVPRFAPVSCDSEFDSSGRCSPAWMGISEGSDYGIVVKAQRPEMENECKANSCSGDDFSQPMVDSVLQPSNVLTQEDCGGETPYRQQLQATQPSMCTQWNKVEEEEEPENSGSLLVDWDPKTGRLQIPTISALQLEPDLAEEERPECDQVKPSDILSNVYVRQSSEESTEYEDALTKMENNWDLQINMEKQYK